MEFLTEEVIEKLLRIPYLLALGTICYVFMRIILELIDAIKKISGK